MESIAEPGEARQDVCLRFVNDHALGPLDRWAASYSDLVAWSRERGLLTPGEADTLDAEAARRPADAAATLARAAALRAALYGILATVAAGGKPEPADLATLNGELARASAALRVVARPGGFAWAWATGETALDRPVWPLARAAAELLVEGDLDRVRECAADDCHWLFIDRSKNRSRRWCDMGDCGNRAKARRYYARNRTRRA